MLLCVKFMMAEVVTVSEQRIAGGTSVRGSRVDSVDGRILSALAAAAAAAFVPAAYFGICTYAARRLSRPDRKALASTPSEYGLRYEDVQFASAEDYIKLSGWLIGAHGDRAIIMLHGRDLTRDRDEAFLEKASILHNHGYDVLMFDFRGHGLSAGERYAMGAWETRDIAGAIHFLEGRCYRAIGTYGVSMGAAISLLAAPDHPEMKALMVDSPYADLPALLRTKLPRVSGLPAFCNPGIFLMGRVMYGIDFSRVKPVDALAKLGDRPVFHVQSRDGDDDVPRTEGYALGKAGERNPNFTTWLAPGKGHVHSYSNNKEEYTRRMLAFYDRYLK